MDENKNPSASTATQTPEAPKRVRRVGRVAFALLLILAGVLLLLQQFVPNFDLLTIARFSPALLIVLGVELLIYSANPNVKVSFDWLSALGCGFILVIVGCSSLVPILWNSYGPTREYAQNRYETQLQDQAYQALNADTDLKARIDNLQISVWFNHIQDGTYTLQDEDSVYLNIELQQNGYADTAAFTADCYRITQLMEQSGIPVDTYNFNSYSDPYGNGNSYSLSFLSSFFEGLSEEQLAQRVSSYYDYDGTSYSSSADRDEAVKAVLREEITGEFLETHDGEYPTEEYLTQEIEKRFQAMTSNGSATPETAA